MIAHTPGPWSIGSTGAVVGGADKQTIPLYSGWVSEAWYGSDATPESEANARLIAAAPELLDVARDVIAAVLADHPNALSREIDWLYDTLGSDLSSAFVGAREAIAKAEGRS